MIDWASWAEAKGLEYKTFGKHGIPIEDIRTIATEKNISFRPGDILFLRTGYVQAYRKLSTEEKVKVAEVREWIGLGQGQATTEFLWNHQFAAVASDSPGFECRRKPEPSSLRPDVGAWL